MGWEDLTNSRGEKLQIIDVSQPRRRKGRIRRYVVKHFMSPRMRERRRTDRL